MLMTLHIENIAVIERADIDFGPGLNVLTGETGAGKSIVIDALGCVLGGRANRELVRSGAEKASVTARFLSGAAGAWCAENGIDADGDEIVLMRSIGADGKSGCRVNGVPVSALQLREFGSAVLDIYGQNDGRRLLDENRHRDYLDGFGDFRSHFEEYGRMYKAYSGIKKEKERLSADMAEKERVTAELRFRKEELESAGLRQGEEEELTLRRDILKNAGTLVKDAEEAYEALYSKDDSAVELVRAALFAAEGGAGVSRQMQKAAETVKQALFLLEDAAETLRDFKSALDFSPEEFDFIEERLSIIRRLAKKYGQNEAGLIRYLSECDEKLGRFEFAESEINKLEKELARQKAQVSQAAEKLSELRRKAAERLQKRMVDELRELNMPSVRFETEILSLQGDEGFDENGRDDIRFLMSANAGEAPGRISRIASGGELSRIMLAMKSVFAENDGAESMVFDEIDAGVSGIAALRVGEKLAEIAKTKQVLCVTHLPQIAAMADAHFVTEKSERGGRTYTGVALLDRDGRRRELARLFGGDNITQTTIASAEEQLRAAELFKNARVSK
ncbi:MAG: DNA repair protein RecN [Oscillospiraceae bacterium]|nr:DNA repair protein RecN [Oscillospiraceae bacterium]